MHKLPLLAVLVTLHLTAHAQSNNEYVKRLAACETQTNKLKRSQCFEVLANDSVTEISRLNVTSVATPYAATGGGAKYAAFVATARARITEGFKDPSSVQWKKVFVSSSRFGNALCGELNGKNSYGGFVGFRRFYTAERNIKTFSQIEGDEGSTFDPDLWRDLCSNSVESIE